MSAEQFEDVLVIRIQRPAGAEPTETKGMTAAAAEQLGEKLAAAQSITVEIAELAFTEELIAAWDLVATMATGVQHGKRNLGGDLPREATDADR